MQPLEHFILPETLAALIRTALDEDIGPGDATVNAVIPAGSRSRARLVAKEEGIVCGLPVFAQVFSMLDPAVVCTPLKQEGVRVHQAETVATLDGPSRALLTGERTALNFLGRLSGIASKAARYAALTAGRHLTILDTRKTTPGLRRLEKYAVQAGGCANHRLGLYDMIMLKENHIRAAGGITGAVARCRDHAPGIPVEVETTCLAEIEEALASGAERIMFDNMDDALIARAVALVAGRAETEASGNMDEARIRALADSGVDFISVGGLTHSVNCLDFSLLFEEN